jgi:hypothetical protein
LIEVRADQLHQYWPRIVSGLVEIKAKRHPTWIPEDIYAALKNGSAVLFMLSETAFAVLQKTFDHDGPRLFVWALYGPNELADRQQEIQQWLKQKARDIGAKAVRMQSPRGWHGVGWTQREVIYELDL